MDGWYAAGTEVVFSCGGSMVNSVITAAAKTEKGKVIGVDTDQASLSDRVITSAQKGLAVSVKTVLTQIYNNEWDAKLGGKTQNLGAAENATGLPTAKDSWRFTKFTTEEYNTVFTKIKTGALTPDATVAENCNDQAFWNKDAFTNVTVTVER